MLRPLFKKVKMSEPILVLLIEGNGAGVKQKLILVKKQPKFMTMTVNTMLHKVVIISKKIY
ncbi:hypothetical protein D3C73_865150 [compost metagenome]